MWGLMGQYLGRDMGSIQKSIVGHVEYTLAMTRFNFSNFVRIDKEVIMDGIGVCIGCRLFAER
jgi:hypothetical protein